MLLSQLMLRVNFLITGGKRKLRLSLEVAELCLSGEGQMAVAETECGDRNRNPWNGFCFVCSLLNLEGLNVV